MSKSKFSVLRIEDDSDEEFSAPITRNTKPQTNGKGKAPPPQQKKNGGLIVHAVETQRQKKKKEKTNKVVDPNTGLIVQDAENEAELAKKERLRQSVVAAAPTSDSPPPIIEEPNGIFDRLGVTNSAKITAEETDMVKYYHQRMNFALEELAKSEQAADAAVSRCNFYKEKYRKLVELFKEAELSEKAKLVLELEKSEATVQELTAQLAQLTSVLEQTRSRLSILEGKK